MRKQAIQRDQMATLNVQKVVLDHEYVRAGLSIVPLTGILNTESRPIGHRERVIHDIEHFAYV